MQPSDVHGAYWAQRLSAVRGFTRHWSAIDPRTEVPPEGLLPFPNRRAQPYLYTEPEIQRLMAAAKSTAAPWWFAWLDLPFCIRTAYGDGAAYP